MGGYLRHIELTRQLEERAKEASRTRQLAEERFGEFDVLFKAAKRSDCKVGDAEELLAQANSALAAKDYRLALEKTKDGEDKVKAAFHQRVQSILDSTESMIGLLRRISQDTSEYEAMASSARDALEKGNFEEAVETAKRGWSKGEKTLHEYISKSFSTTQAFILAAKALEKDTAAAEDLLVKARSALEADDYDEALSQTEEAQDILGRELDLEMMEERKAVDQLMEAGKALDIDLTKAVSYLGKFEKELEASQYEKAFNFLKQTKTEAERQLKKALEAGAATLEAPIKEAKKLGADTGVAEELAQEVEKAAKKGDFTTASQLIRKGIQELENSKFQRVLKTISHSRPKFLRARDLGADVASAMEILNKARKALQDGNFKDALYYADKGNKALDDLIAEFEASQDKMEVLAAEVRSLSGQGVDVAEVQRLLRTATEELTQGNLASWSSLAQRIEKHLSGERREKASEIQEEAQFLLTFGEKAGLDLAGEKDQLHDLSQALREEEVTGALQSAMAIKESLEERISSYLQERLQEIQEILPLGEDSQASQMIEKATTALGIKDFDTALRMAEEAYAKGEAQAKERAAEGVEGLKAAQQLATDHNLEIPGLREAYLSAKKALDGGDIPAALSHIKPTLDHLSNVAQNSFEGVRDRVVEARDVGINIDSMKTKLIQAKEAIDADNLVKGVTFLRDADQLAKETLDVYGKVHSITSSTAALVAEGRKKGVDMTRSVELLLKAKTSFESGELEAALEHARDARAEAEKEMSVLNVTDRILAAKEALDLAQMLEVDVSVWANLLRRAKQSLNAQDFREGVELAMEVEEQARAGARDKINVKTARAESLLDKVQVPAKDVDQLQAAIHQAKELLNDRKLGEAADIAQRALTGCEELVEAYESVVELTRKGGALATELQSMNVKVSGPEKLLAKADKAYGEGNLKHAGQLAEEALSQLERLRKESVERTLKNFEATVARAQAEGIKTSGAQQHLKKARALFEEGEFQEAVAAAMKAENDVEKMGLQKEIAENALETARARIAALPNPVPLLKKMISESEKSFEAGDYVASLETAITVGDEYTKIRETWEQVESSEETALSFYKTAELTGADVSKLSSLLVEAKKAMESGDLEDAKESFDELASKAANLTSSFVTKIETDIRNATVICSLLNCEVEGVDDKLSQGRSYADENRFDSALKILSEAKEETYQALRNKVGELLSEAQAALEHAIRVGIDAKKAEGMVEEAKEAMASDQFDKAVRLVQQSLEALQSKEDFHRRFMEVTLKAESLVKTAKKFGIEVKGAEKGLKRAFGMKDSDPDKAIQEGEAALRVVEESLESFSPGVQMDLDLEEANKDTWTDAVLKLQNEGKALGKDLQVEVMGALEVRELETPTTIRAKGDADVRFQVKFEGVGTIPVMVKVKAKRVLDGREYEWEQVFDVEVDGSAVAEPANIIAEYDSKCSLCRGAIKKGFTAKRCTCDAVLHEPCANRAGKCPSCGRKF